MHQLINDLFRISVLVALATSLLWCLTFTLVKNMCYRITQNLATYTYIASYSEIQIDDATSWL